LDNLSRETKILLFKTPILGLSEVYITGSKSESNRALILNALSGNEAPIVNLSTARDTQTMEALLNSADETLDVLDAGTTMRFLTAYIAASNQTRILTGTDRMKQRPIKILVDALREIGSEISYLEKDGYPPLKISGLKVQENNKIQIRGDVSSQYISALLMIAAALPKGLHLTLIGEIGSRPYIRMTLNLMEQFGLSFTWEGNVIHIESQAFRPKQISIEPDWSGASYWYSFLAMSKQGSLKIPALKKYSLQGDSVISKLSKPLGISTEFKEDGILLTKSTHEESVEFDFKDCPDLAQTIAVICAAKNIIGKFSGLKSLRIKETDRIKALQNELAKINAKLIQEGEDDYRLIPSQNLPDSASIVTYEDHRMAMAFAPLSMVMDIEIHEPEVVNKSYPSFWDEVRKIGVKTSGKA
jgi:3-phosphoshikimate 1-carboxyvinyltransferase